MKSIQGNRLSSLRAAQQFIAEHAERLPQVADSGARHRLDELVGELDGFVTEQAGNTIQAQGATRKLHALRQVLLRDHMAPIVSIARAELAGTPELVSIRRLPRGTPSVEKLAAAAEGMAREADLHAAVFIRAGLPHDFVMRLTAAAEAVVDAASQRTLRRGRASGATVGLKGRLAAGRRVVDVLDTFVRTATHDDPALLAHWRSVRAVHAPAGRPSSRAPGDDALKLVPRGPETASAQSSA
jgi:hypothetical protein